MAKKKKGSNIQEVQNAAKTLFANIQFMSPDNPIRTVALTSSVPNEGKSTTAIELAKAIASAGKQVILVECDMRRRSLASMLQVHPCFGLHSVITEQAELGEAVTETSTPNLYFLDVEPNIPNPSDIISSKKFRRLTANLASNYDYVIYDTPPVGTFVDAAVLSKLVDGVLLVVRMESTKREEIEHATEQLNKAEAEIIGVIATFCESIGSSYYNYYSKKKGKKGKAPAASNAPLATTPGYPKPKEKPATAPVKPRHSSGRL